MCITNSPIINNIALNSSCITMYGIIAQRNIKSRSALMVYLASITLSAILHPTKELVKEHLFKGKIKDSHIDTLYRALPYIIIGLGCIASGVMMPSYNLTIANISRSLFSTLVIGYQQAITTWFYQNQKEADCLKISTSDLILYKILYKGYMEFFEKQLTELTEVKVFFTETQKKNLDAYINEFQPNAYKDNQLPNELKNLLQKLRSMFLVTLLKISAKENDEDFLELLTITGLDVNQSYSNDQMTALHWAAFNGHLACITSLIKAGADPYQLNKFGCNALDYARFHNHSSCADLLEKTDKKIVELDEAE